MKIALLCPTRERIPKVQKFIESIVATADSCDNFILYLGIDEDDPTLPQAKELEKKYYFVENIVIKNNGEFLGLGVLWNRMVEDLHPDMEIFAMVGDDMEFKTKSWDTEILKEFNDENLPDDKIKMVYLNDGMHGPGNPKPNVKLLAVNSFLHRKYVELTGRYVLDFKHGYHDTWLHEVFERAGRLVYRKDLVLLHLHHSHPDNHEVKDAVTKRLQASYKTSPVNAHVEYKKMAGEREEEAQMLLSHIESCKKKVKPK